MLKAKVVPPFPPNELFQQYRDSGGRCIEVACDCGSGLASEWERDAQGIELCRACTRCRTAKLKRYRPEILTGYTQADVNEPIEPEE